MQPLSVAAEESLKSHSFNLRGTLMWRCVPHLCGDIDEGKIGRDRWIVGAPGVKANRSGSAGQEQPRFHFQRNTHGNMAIRVS